MIKKFVTAKIAIEQSTKNRCLLTKQLTVNPVVLKMIMALIFTKAGKKLTIRCIKNKFKKISFREEIKEVPVGYVNKSLRNAAYVE